MPKPDLSVSIAGIKSPNPFWVASGPPSNTEGQAHRAFEAGWGGLVWKTIGEPIVNVSSRYSALRIGNLRMAGFNNIELISDRDPAVNFREFASVKKRWPDRVLIASLMLDSREEWHDFVHRAEDAGADGIELNFGCPHGMCERGMGSAVGQNPDVAECIVGWVKEVSTIPVLVKLTPNITDIVVPGLASKRAGADAISLINTISSITNVDLDQFVPEPNVHGRSTSGGYCGPAVKPIALRMIQQIASQVELPISGIGGIMSWKDAAEFIALGASTVQVCSGIMYRGFGMVKEMISGLEEFLQAREFPNLDALRGKATASVTAWEQLDINFRRVARIDYTKCIGCNLCYTACEDGAYQAIGMVSPVGLPEGPRKHPERPVPKILDEVCVGCNLCMYVCPVERCITMEQSSNGAERMSWEQYQNRVSHGTVALIPPKP